MDENCDYCFHPIWSHEPDGCTGTLGNPLRRCFCTHHEVSSMSPGAKTLADAIRRIYRALPESQSPRDAAMLMVEQVVLERLANDVSLLERAAR